MRHVILFVKEDIISPEISSRDIKQDAQSLANYFNETIFLNEKPIILKPNPDISDSSLEFFVFRPKSS